ncbi:hypothetical protein NXG27_01055 [Megasphaera paucivorans]|uniref:Rad52/22 family double-strand break repair protein n=1 Tax=Megasphaera paucivorans TaxID=349095 RepID=A0A1G9QGJ8_9FIRM|nr:hypothetical protein [Megasphaera paucivorans]SDM09425.1 hypothetical protein SAMN05660299_00212 [Megasphaera paucivorans]
MDKKIPLLTANDIECRIQMITKNNKALVLLYKNARVDMRVLDEVFGPMNWQREHQVVNNNLFCTIAVWDESKKAWISKQDVGVPSQTEAEKGQASDAFKRAGTCWGIGRELYDVPPIFILLDKTEIVPRSNGKTTSYAKFYVKSIQYDETLRKFTELSIVDSKGKSRYSLQSPVKSAVTVPKQNDDKSIGKENKTQSSGAQAEKQTNDVTSNAANDIKMRNHYLIEIVKAANVKEMANRLPSIIQEEYGVNSINKLTFEQAKEMYENIDFILDTAMAEAEDKEAVNR